MRITGEQSFYGQFISTAIKLKNDINFHDKEATGCHVYSSLS